MTDPERTVRGGGRFVGISAKPADLLRFVLSSRVEIAAIAIKLASAFFSFLIVFIVARVSGASVTGNYALALSTSNLLALVAMLGLDQIVTRAIGGDLREGRPDLARAAIMAALRLVAPFAALLVVLAYLAAPFATYIAAPPDAIRAIALSILAFPLLRLAVVSLRASGAIFWSQLFDGAHSFLVLTTIGCLLLLSDSAIDSVLLAAIYSGSVAASMIAAWSMLRNRTREWPVGSANVSPMLTRSWPILVAGLGHAFVTWFVLAYIGAVMDSGEVGAFRVASQVVTLIAIMMTTIESLVNPQFAGDFRVKDIGGAWRRHRRTTAIMLLVSSIPVAVCLIIPAQILGLFGPEFVVAKNALFILALGQFVNVLTGPIGGVMVMSGYEGLSLLLSVVGLIVALVVSLALTPVFGLIGAACAISGAMVTRNLAAFAILRYRLRPQ